MNDELDLSEEEMAACVFFILAWRYVGVGPEMRAKALLILPDDSMGKVPPHIRENIAVRLRRSMCGTGYEWVDRAVPGYSATILAAYERRFGNTVDELAAPVEISFIEAFRDEIGRSRPGRCVGGLLLHPGGVQERLDAKLNPIERP